MKKINELKLKVLVDDDNRFITMFVNNDLMFFIGESKEFVKYAIEHLFFDNEKIKQISWYNEHVEEVQNEYKFFKQLFVDDKVPEIANAFKQINFDKSKISIGLVINKHNGNFEATIMN